MENRLHHQLQGFIETPLLWKNKDLFDLEQFEIPSFILPEDLNIEEELPSLNSNFVLGKRMERYFELLLKFSEGWQILEKNVQIQKDKITIGELDFLLKNSSSAGKIFHVELVYKFYVYDPSLKKETSRWIGPNRNDSLLQKISKLKQQQFPLLFNPATQYKLKYLSLSRESIKQEVCFKAQLFVPKEMINNKFSGINEDCICGYWIRMEMFSSEEFRSFKYAFPIKQDWPVSPGNNKDWISYSEVKEKIQEAHLNKKSPLIWVKKGDLMFEKFFVVWW